ncbi:MAG: DHA2 family efflux MFS transporter permease subunit [Alphaproteobacteria bacterium]|nr:DHA2 family efflux MFS transporter permease subunit [Alphaproteobacteria bacterium]
MPRSGGPAAAAAQGWTPARSVAGGRNPWTIIAVISIATFMVVLDTSIANVALDHIAGSLSASYDEATWVITSFLISNAIVIPVSGWLADVLGRKRYYMMSVALFTASSLLCGMAPNLAFLIVARVLQGIGGGGLAPVEQSMMVDTFPPAKRGAAFAAYGVVVIVGPILGPSVGGWITDNLSWHWVFLINVPIGLLSLFLVSLYVDEPDAMVRERKKLLKRGLKIDVMGFALVALFLGCLEVTLDRGQREDWFSSPMIVGFAILGAAAFLAFIPWELSRDEPIVRIRLYGNRNFLIANIFMVMMGVIIFGTTQFIPQLLQQVLGYTATNAGLALTMGGLATLFVMPVAGFLTGRVDPRWLIGMALAIQGIALWNMSTLNTQISFENAALARMVQSVGLPFLFVPITNAAYVGLDPKQNNQASALMNVSRNLGGTFGISLVQTMLAQRAQVHQAQYVEQLNPLNPNYVAAIGRATHALTAHGMAQAEAARAAAAHLYRALGQQASMLAYIDVFHTLMIVVFCALPLVLLMQKPKTGGARGEAAA